MRLLVDENLSPVLVQRLADVGVVARYAYAHDLVVVTSNAADFLQLAGQVELHPGVIVLRAGYLTREEQWEWLRPVVRRFSENRGDLVNRVVVVTGPGRFRARSIPPP